MGRAALCWHQRPVWEGILQSSHDVSTLNDDLTIQLHGRQQARGYLAHGGSRCHQLRGSMEGDVEYLLLLSCLMFTTCAGKTAPASTLGKVCTCYRMLLRPAMTKMACLLMQD